MNALLNLNRSVLVLILYTILGLNTAHDLLCLNSSIKVLHVRRDFRRIRLALKGGFVWCLVRETFMFKIRKWKSSISPLAYFVFSLSRWDKRSRAFVVDNLFSIECAELDDLVAVLEVKPLPPSSNSSLWVNPPSPSVLVLHPLPPTSPLF